MRSPITRAAVAAAVIVAVLIGITQLGGSPAGVAWGEVAQKIEASPGLIYRERTLDPNESDGGAYVMVYASPTHLRIDSHKGTAITRSIYVDCAARESVVGGTQ